VLLSPELFLDLLPDLLPLTSGGRPSRLSVPFLPKSKLPVNFFPFYHHQTQNQHPQTPKHFSSYQN